MRAWKQKANRAVLLTILQFHFAIYLPSYSLKYYWVFSFLIIYAKYQLKWKYCQSKKSQSQNKQ